MTKHEHTDRCTSRLTGDALTALGFPVRVTEKCVMVETVVREGTSLETAKYLAWVAGVAVLCTHTGREHMTGEEPEWCKRMFGRAEAA